MFRCCIVMSAKAQMYSYSGVLPPLLQLLGLGTQTNQVTLISDIALNLGMASLKRPLPSISTELYSLPFVQVANNMQPLAFTS